MPPTQVFPAVHVPHEPAQPSVPQVLPVQSGVQAGGAAVAQFVL